MCERFLRKLNFYSHFKVEKVIFNFTKTKLNLQVLVRLYESYNIFTGLHHAVSMGTIDSHAKPIYTSQTDRNYDSEDENTHRRRLRHTSSTELYAKPSHYSKGDIREQVTQ